MKTTVTHSTRHLTSGIVIHTLRWQDGRQIDFACASLMADYVYLHDLEIVL